MAFPYPCPSLTGLYLLWLQAEGPFPYALVARGESQCYFELPDEVANPNPSPNPSPNPNPNPNPNLAQALALALALALTLTLTLTLT